jgi:hypothetical protein
MSKLIITKDKFVFVDVSTIAKKLLGTIELYAYFDQDDIEWAIDSVEEIDEALELSVPIVIEGGHLPKMKPFGDISKTVKDGYIYVKYSDLF